MNSPDCPASPRHAALLLALLALAGCASPRASLPPTPPPDIEVMAYPNAGQTPREVRQDRYECYLWAVRESGFDPSRMRVTAPPPPPRVVADPPVGYDTAMGIITGAVIGAALGDPRHVGTGAAVGAAVGGAAGAVSDSARAARAQNIEDAYAARAARSDYGNWRRAEAYRRALAACLEGRGYTVR